VKDGSELRSPRDLLLGFELFFTNFLLKHGQNAHDMYANFVLVCFVKSQLILFEKLMVPKIEKR
jgi:hypothetical protein